jgi:glycosyltransferase involved in cell wall biosynthesis
MSQEQARWTLGLGPDRPVVPTIDWLTHMNGQWYLIDAVPDLAARVVGSAEVVDDGVTGVLVRPADPVALAAAVARLLADLALRRLQGAAGRRRYEARFTRARMAAETAAVYASVLAGAEVAA